MNTKNIMPAPMRLDMVGMYITNTLRLNFGHLLCCDLEYPFLCGGKELQFIPMEHLGIRRFNWKYRQISAEFKEMEKKKITISEYIHILQYFWYCTKKRPIFITNSKKKKKIVFKNNFQCKLRSNRNPLRSRCTVP